MSAPTPAPGDDRPREGYYPDPSIPGYVRYWNGAAWVPGTSRPAPKDGEPLAPPPGVRPAQPAVEETGPHFFDEDPVDGASPPESQHGSRPEPASAWGADRSRQSGFGGDQDRRVSWGSPQSADPRVPHPSRPADDGPDEARPADAPAQQPDGLSARTDGTATIPPAASDRDAGSTFVFRRPTATPGGAGASGGGASGPGAGTPGVPGPGGPASDEGTMTFRAVSPRTGQPGGGAAGSTGAPHHGSGAPGFGAGKAAAARAAAAQAAAGAQAPTADPAAPSGPQSVPATPQHPAPAPGPTPLTSGPGGGQSSWAQQVHRLAGTPGDEQPVAPWKPPVEDVFQAAARRQAAARPAPIGKRLAARLLDTVVLAGVTAVAAVPLGTRAIDHVNDKIDAARLSGETVTVWLLDGTTSLYLGIVLAVLLLFGVVYEALPTAKWGRTLGKKLLGLEVRDIEGHEAPDFGAALRRWLVYSVPGLLVVGIVGVVWCLFDRPWHQCWHDKAAHTFVAG
ncbi:RDD family protein [Streptomyces sp. S.PNR 29]|uniref:RDD family protein n=1 Tax=Streptomyces sp. S.PNR 29 TaxID=2973805 RepID=UPI0025B0A111|nr:RDD family protein [Streptomyces sp. S.PNR 29]MDN0197124.1 RDD family protein [Streptomyces sp. S.PNR 29]